MIFIVFLLFTLVNKEMIGQESAFQQIRCRLVPQMPRIMRPQILWRFPATM